MSSSRTRSTTPDLFSTTSERTPLSPSVNSPPSLIADKVTAATIEVDGKFKSEYETAAQAMKVGLELKKKYPQIQVKVYDAKQRTRTLVELSAVP